MNWMTYDSQTGQRRQVPCAGTATTTTTTTDGMFTWPSGTTASPAYGGPYQTGTTYAIPTFLAEDPDIDPRSIAALAKFLFPHKEFTAVKGEGRYRLHCSDGDVIISFSRCRDIKSLTRTIKQSLTRTIKQGVAGLAKSSLQKIEERVRWLADKVWDSVEIIEDPLQRRWYLRGTKGDAVVQVSFTDLETALAVDTNRLADIAFEMVNRKLTGSK